MTDKDTALRLALEFLEVLGDNYWNDCQQAIIAIKAALLSRSDGEAKDEPVAWMTINAYGEEDDIHYENPEGHLPEGWTYKPLYTHPPSVQSENEPLEYWNAVEGWVKIDEVREHFDSVSCGTIYKHEGEGRVPLYTTPPQRLLLTDEPIENAIHAWFKPNSDGTYGTWPERMRAAIKAAQGIIDPTDLKGKHDA